MYDAEFESFKNEIDLRAYAAGQGYVIDRKESWRGSAVMRHANGDKIIVKRDTDGHFVYFSVRRDDDNGTILDFVKNRLRLSLGDIRKELRPWIGKTADLAFYPPLEKTGKDRARVEARYAYMREARGHPYLEGERRIPADLLISTRFTSRIRIDARGNAVFPHFDGLGLCGFEMKNAGFTGFAAGGTKGLWLSHEFGTDGRLVIAESAIDAVSHAALFPDLSARYASIGGKPNPTQPELIRAAAARMPAGSEIVAAMDADSDGRKLAELVRRAVELTGRADLRFRIHEPAGFKDFNDQLRARRSLTLPYRQETPSVS